MSALRIPQNERLGGIVYMNNAATTYPKAKATIAAFTAALQAVPGGTRQGMADDVVESARRVVARAVGGRSAEVFFVSGATLAFNMAITGCIERGGSCIIDNRSHNAIVRTVANAQLSWRSVALYDCHDRLDANALLEACFTPPSPQLICLTHASNVTGTIYDVSEVIRHVRKHAPGAVILVDASQSAGVVPLGELADADIAIFPGHKHLYGPPGSAALVTRVPLRPSIYGGTGRESSKLEVDQNRWHRWLEVGTPDVPAIAALAAGLEDFEINGREHTQCELDLLGQLAAELAGVEELELVGPVAPSRRAPIVAYRTLYGDPETEWTVLMRQAGVIVRGGLHCSPLHHAQLGLSRGGTLRFSLGRFNESREICEVGEVARDIGRSLRRLS